MKCRPSFLRSSFHALAGRCLPLAGVVGGFLPLAAAPVVATSPGDQMAAAYFQTETARLAAQTAADLASAPRWNEQRERYREQLFDMLGLSPRPERTDLQAVVTGGAERADVVVENLHFQSLPGLYATANLYLPKQRSGPLPAILYVCGHGNVKEGGVSYGAKVNYQHHGAWFARHGYACLVLDTIQLGELEGLHHGTYREGMWWWNARGYTPAGVEAWNAIRALDYLQSRPEIDGTRIGMTGRSGGGSYTWVTAALDERVKVAVPVAGITDLHNYVIDGCVTGHCDCMFVVNTHRWDYAKIAALIAPRPLLFSNTDKDRIFPLDGVIRVHRSLAALYASLQASDKLGLLITEGPHKDTQELQVPALRWFNRFLRGDESPIRLPTEKLFTPRELKVFATLPAPQRTTAIHQSFVPMASPILPADAAAWPAQREAWLRDLRQRTFAGWPTETEPLQPRRTTTPSGAAPAWETWEYTSQGAFRLPLYVLGRDDGGPKREIHVYVPDESGWAAFARTLPGLAAPSAAASGAGTNGTATLDALQARAARGEITLVVAPPRGVGPTTFGGTPMDRVQLRRRFMLLGQTLDGMRVWDIRRALEALRERAVLGAGTVHLHGERHQAANVLYASLFVDGVAGIELIEPPASHATGPDYLNVLRILDLPQAAVIAAERAPVTWTGASREAWSWTAQAAARLGWPSDRLRW